MPDAVTHDGIHDIFRRILPLTKMIHSGAQIEIEKVVSNIVWSLPIGKSP